ncbi:monovalent cation/H+ antiporter complex subunit F [Thiocapsa bogorovii]|uniref:monovalent cation/H+ antiporter complex subunit F n=1 Tax=Thiocapsa bogorovii TaxID=521689 RepID=UPI001E4062B4|nr:monovalent cation/H+ antiporter complex subunit F [Thiocapsa bogorovii]UHD17538.1 monovalent cation/H+ antiporter complex subunit F [Thiocapsa bogorovii]
MSSFLLAAAAFVLGTVALGLWRILRGPRDVDRMLAPQLLGTGGVAALLLLGEASQEAAIADVAMVLALLAAFASVAFVVGAIRPELSPEPGSEPGTELAPDRAPAHEDAR